MKIFWLLLLFLLSAQFAAKAGVMEISGINKLSQARQIEITDWLEEVHRSVFDYLGPGRFPSAIPVSVKSEWFTSQPVPWGEVRRSQNHRVSDGIHLVIGRFSAIDSIADDWTAYHEMSHLYLPYIAPEYFWLSEGFATYMQNMIMFNNGRYNRADVMTKIRAGLQRGKAQNLKLTQPLSELASDMWQQNAYMRVYWSGTAYFIEVDFALKQKGLRLNQVIRSFNQCCRSDVTRSHQLITQLDKASNTAIFSTHFVRYQNRRDFPSIKMLEKKLTYLVGE